MSKSLKVPKESPQSDVPQTKIAKELTGDDYRESLLTQAKLEEALKGKKGILPKRERIFRIADKIIEQLNKLDNKADQEGPNSDSARKLDQLQYQFGTENIIDLAMILSNLQIKKEEKERFKKLTGENGIIDLNKIKPDETLTGDLQFTTVDATRQEQQATLTGQSSTPKK